MNKPIEEDQAQIGKITKQADGRYNSYIRAASTQAKIDILPNIHKAADAITDAGGMTQGIEIGAIWTRKMKPPGRTM